MDKTGGPAFPVPNLEWDEAFNGMTLLDWLAGQALISMQVRPDDIATPEDADIYADKAFMLAAAMLRRRTK